MELRDICSPLKCISTWLLLFELFGLAGCALGLLLLFEPLELWAFGAREDDAFREELPRTGGLALRSPLLNRLGAMYLFALRGISCYFVVENACFWSALKNS
jgi:hypothetical protein